MQPQEFRAIRKQLKMSALEWARELGYDGSEKTVVDRIAKLERGKTPIPPYIARLAYLIQEHFLAEDALPQWPDWGYKGATNGPALND